MILGNDHILEIASVSSQRDDNNGRESIHNNKTIFKIHHNVTMAFNVHVRVHLYT